MVEHIPDRATLQIGIGGMGQCASETLAGRYWSSSGGQADFARGAMYSEGGKAFIVPPSTTSKGRSSSRSPTRTIARRSSGRRERPRSAR